jgi:flagellar biosynthesis/type III secretory pathway M-ring protein FliF/YscJ
VSVLGIVLVVIVVLVALLVVGGIAISQRRARAHESRLQAELEEANQALASAHADDKGWHRDLLDQAAREAFAQRSAADVRELQLVQVVDKPGKEEDQAVFRVITDHGSEYLHLDRHGDRWLPR